jgi:parallel beta-helix repeat protein
MKEKIFIVGIIAFLLIISFSGCIEDESRIIYVDYRGEADYTKIQNAIDNASEGDSVYVRNGTYYELLSINKSINLIGANKNQTIINYKNSNKNQHGIIVIKSNNVTIKGFQIISSAGFSKKVGININSSYNIVTNNILLNNHHGINISKGTKNNNISLNTISNSRLYGVSISSSNNNIVIKNNISLSGFYGVYLTLSNENILVGNTISESDFYGIRIKASENNEVYQNIIFNNNRGIYLCCGSVNNIISYNIFKKNIDYNARDDIFNQWDNGSVGNYWDDYNGTDDNGDGIGDISYDIADGYGEANNQDRYPLISQFDIKSKKFKH